MCKNEKPSRSRSLSATGGEVAFRPDSEAAANYSYLQLSTPIYTKNSSLCGNAHHRSATASRRREARRGSRSTTIPLLRVLARPSKLKRGQERLTKKLEQKCCFRFPISPTMRKPDVTCSARINNLPWAAPKRSQPAAYGRLWQARAGYGRRINILGNVPGVRFLNWRFRYLQLSACICVYLHKKLSADRKRAPSTIRHELVISSSNPLLISAPITVH